MRLSGWVRTVHRRGGKILSVREGANLVVDAGEALVAGIMDSVGPVRPSHFAIGDSSAAIAAGQTSLQGTEHARLAFGSQVLTGNQLAYRAIFNNGSAGPWLVQEAGIFNDAVAGTMLARFLTQKATIAVGETLDITWTLTYGG